MITLVNAIYENGVLRPLTPLDLPEHTQVQISVQPLPTPDEAQEHRRQVHEALVAAGLIRPTSASPSTRQPLSPEERAELARRFSGDRPLSDLIIEEREGR